MPSNFQGKPTDEQLLDPRNVIVLTDEKRLLDLAESNGIKDINIGSFFVVMSADLPYVVSDEEYQVFSEQELIEESKKYQGWFYDTDKKRLIGTIPPANQIFEGMRNQPSKSL